MIVLVNPSKKVTYGFVNKYGKDVVVKPGKEVIVEEADIINLHATSKTFSKGYLKFKNITDLPENVRSLFVNEEDVFEIKEDEITAKIKGRIGEFNEFMKQVEERSNQNEKRAVFEIAKSIEDLNMKKARKIEEVTGFDFKLEETINTEDK